jgi:hypothetical protein
MTTTDPKSPKRRHWRRNLALIILAIVILYAGLIARDVLLLRADVLALQDYGTELPTPIKVDQIDVPFAQQHVTSIHENLSALRSHAAPLLAIAPAFGWLPGIGGDVQAAPALIDMALQFTAIGDQALKALAPFWPPPPVSNGGTLLPTIARILQWLQPDMRSFRANIDRAAEIRQPIDSSKLSPRLRSVVDKFDSLYPSMTSGLSLLSVAPQLLGADRPRTYLILLQNEDELRPTGGFISAVGRITLDAGRIVSLTVEDSYQIDDFTKPYGDPPAPLLDLMGSELWVFRDSNWSPDFPTAARQAIELYTYTRDGSIDGVIALDQAVVEALVAGLGPLPIDAAQPALTADNIRAYMQRAWAPSGQTNSAEWYEQRKNFIGRLMQALLDRALKNSASIQLDTLARRIDAVLRGHDLMIYFTDPAINAAMAEATWDGALQPIESDYLMIVDANLGFNKANAVMRQAIAYTATLGIDRASTADLAITYAHTGPFVAGCPYQVPGYGLNVTYDQLVQLCYHDYRRVYTPAGAQLMDATRFPTNPGELVTGGVSDGSTSTTTENDRTVFSTFFIVGRGQQLISRLHYSLPDGIIQDVGSERIYHLQLQKQSGIGSWPVTVKVIWPQSWRLKTAMPAPIDTSNFAAIFQLTLDADRDVRVVFASQ